jgi:broad specificity phosphatase PhoE
MGNILIVNTGPTEFERMGQYPVLDESGLDAPTGVWAQAIAKRLAEYRLAAVYFLPFPEAVGTAGIIAANNKLEAKALPGFEGSGQFEWKGLSPEESAVLDCSLDEGRMDASCIKFPFNLDLGQLRLKIASALDEIIARHKKQYVAIVSHRAISVVMVLHLLNMDNSHYNQIAQENGAVNMFEVRMGLPSALLINDVCHLEGIL